MNRSLLLAMRLSILGGLFATSLGFDPIAQQVFREPKMLAMIWLAGFLLVVWGFSALGSLGGRRPVLLPPIPLLVLIPLILAVGANWLVFYPGGDAGGGIPVQVHYQIHVLLPVLSWFVLFACSSFLFRTSKGLRLLGMTAFLALAFQTTVVLSEVVENRTGMRANPVGWLGTLDLGAGVVKQRIFGTIGNPNFVGGYLAIALMASIGWLVGLKSRYSRIVCGLVLACALLGLIVTRSKGALLALVVGAGHWLITGWLSRPKRADMSPRSTSRRWAVVAVVLVVAIGVGGLILVESASDPLEGSYVDRWAETLALQGDSITVRALLAYCGFEMWEDRPWFGWGAGGFKVNFLDRLKTLLEGPGGERLVGRVNRLHSLRASHLHNEYLQVLVEWGIFGFALVQLFLGWCQFSAFHRIERARSPAERSLRLGFLSAFWCGLGGSLFDMPFHRPEQAYLLAIVLGACLGRSERDRGAWAGTSRFRPVAALSLAVVLIPLGTLMTLRASGKYIAQRDVYVARRILEGAYGGADPGKVESALRKAIELAPGDGDYDYLMALFELEAKRDPGAAIARIRRARYTCDDPDLYLLEARAQIERNNFASVEPIVEFVEALDPDQQGLHYLKGRLLQNQGSWGAACAAYHLEISNAEAFGWKTAPHLAQCYFRLADILERELGQYEQAAGYYKRLLELQGDSKQGYPTGQIRLAEMYRDRFFDLDRAEAYFRGALEIFEYQRESDEAATIRGQIQEIERRRAEFQLLSQQ